MTLNEPAYVSMCILDLSKTSMYDFYYNYMKKTFSLKAKLLFAHRGSLPYEIETNDLCKNFHKDKDKFNFSEYPNNSKFLT